MADTISEVARLGPFLLIVLAACGSEHGAYLAIDSPVPLTRVELFVGDTTVNDPGSCLLGSGCRIGPPPTDLSAPLGVRYTGDGYTSRSTAAQVATVSGTKLTYHLEADGDDETLPSMLIVGYDANGPAAALVVHDVPVTSSPQRLAITLIAVGPITGTSGERLQVWRRPGDDTANAQSACAVMVHGDARQPEWFVPADDTDCDGALPQDPAVPECKNSDAPWNYCGVYPPSLGQADTMVSVTGGACRLSGLQCADAGPACAAKTGEALTVPIGCLDPQYCHAGSQSGCSAFDQACLGAALTASTLPRITCPALYAGTPTPTPCTTRIDPTGAGGTASPLIAGRTVSRVDISQVEPFQTAKQSVVVAGATYTVVPTATPSVYDVEITGTAIDGPGVLLLDFVTDPAPTQHRLIELSLEPTTTQCMTNPPAPCVISTTQYICP
jgi:hypothetical protein